MIFHKLGEFSQTRATFQHKKKIKKEEKVVGQKTSPLILRKQYKIAERAQYCYGKTGSFFFSFRISTPIQFKTIF